MKYKELKQACMVINQLKVMTGWVSKERFDMVAKVKFDVTREQQLDVMYGLVNSLPSLIWQVSHEDDKFVRTSETLKHLPLALEILEAAYEMRPKEFGADSLPVIDKGRYRKEDMRRYFYKQGDERKQIDIHLHSRANVLLLAELLKRDDVALIGVAEHLGYLDGPMTGPNNTRIHYNYYDGDIYFLYGDVLDRVFYSYIGPDDAGVYLATADGWRKLLYTPSRGYLDKGGEPDMADDTHYSDYKLEGSGRAFRYIGNIYCDASVLIEPKPKED